MTSHVELHMTSDKRKTNEEKQSQVFEPNFMNILLNTIFLEVFSSLTKYKFNQKSKVKPKAFNKQSSTMGMKLSSLTKSASTENKEIQELEVKLAGERGRSINQTQNIIGVSSEEFLIETDSDMDYESDEGDEEGM